jgi:hypothetical protein
MRINHDTGPPLQSTVRGLTDSSFPLAYVYEWIVPVEEIEYITHLLNSFTHYCPLAVLLGSASGEVHLHCVQEYFLH